jgi:hypothetical protein
MTIEQDTDVAKAARELTAANTKLTHLQQEETRIRQRRAQAERDVHVCQGNHNQAITRARVRAARDSLDDIYQDPNVREAAKDKIAADQKLLEAEQAETRIRQDRGQLERTIQFCQTNYNEAVKRARSMTARDVA